MSEHPLPISHLSNLLFGGGRCLYMPNGGNLGDNLIACATIQAFRRAGIRWEFMRGGRENIRKGDVVVYGGGGSLVPLYRGGIDCLKFLNTFDCPVIVLPHTVRGHEDFWATTKPMTVFCRDEASLQYLGKFEHVTAMAADDMATGLDLHQKPFSSALRLKEWHDRSGAETTLSAFRGDHESATARNDGRNLDVSELTSPDFSSIESIYSNATFFLSVIASYRFVETDRLHVAVAASLLGIPTVLHDNSYGKNLAVYQQTLKRKFPLLRLAST